MFTTLIVQPIFNLLVLIYALLPGHNFGLAIIIFTIIIRLLLWPLVKKQLHQTKIMRKLQPEVKRIKEQTKGDRQKQSLMMMELYKERGVNPLASFPTLIIQFIVLIGLYSGLRKVIDDPHTIVSFAYPALQHFSWMQHLAVDPRAFDDTLFGVVNLKRAAISDAGFYFPAFVLVALSAITQYFATKQLMPNDKSARSLRQILREAGEGKQADQSEVSAAVGRSTRFFIPAMIFLFTISLASALSLYWFVGGLVAYIQQAIVLREDEEELEEIADQPSAKLKKNVKKIPEARVVEIKNAEPKSPKPKTKKSRKKRRRR